MGPIHIFPGKSFHPIEFEKSKFQQLQQPKGGRQQQQQQKFLSQTF